MYYHYILSFAFFSWNILWAHLNKLPELVETHVQHLKPIPEELPQSILKHYLLEYTESLLLWHLWKETVHCRMRSNI